MAEKVIEKKVDFNEQMAGERQFYMGKLSDTDNIPGSDITLGEAKETFEKQNAEFEQAKFERQQKVLNTKPSEIHTSTVAPGVVVNNQMPQAKAVVPDAIADANGLPPLPSDEELEATDTKGLIALGVSRKVDIKANVDGKPAMIAKLKGIYVSKEDAQTVSLSGKTREEVNFIATYFDIDGTDKEKFPNLETLTKAIEEKRKK